MTQNARLTHEQVRSYLPFLRWLRAYRRADLPGDLIAGATVAAMLVPQGMAYALLAGLPPVVGLYAGILPVIIYGLLGSTRVLTLGPTAITSVMVLGTLAPLTDDAGTYLTLSLTLALLLGLVYLGMGLLRLGFVANLLNQSVIVGYVNAAALIITFSQLQNLLGISVPRSSNPFDLLWQVAQHVEETHLPTLALGVCCLLLLIGFRRYLDAPLTRLGLGPTTRFMLTRSGPLVVIVASILAVSVLDLSVRVVGDIPQGAPPLAVGPFDLGPWQALLSGAVAIAFVGLMESISTAKSLTVQRQQRVDANQEMIAMGAANVASALSGGLAVTSSISRSAVNTAAGARTGLSSVIAGGLVFAVVLVFAPLFHDLPNATLAAIILAAVINLIDFEPVREIWRYSKVETLPFAATFVSVFFVNIALGILLGVVVSVGLYLLRTIVPRVQELARAGYTEHYQGIDHPGSIIVPHVLLLRIDESLYFANAQYLDRALRNLIAERESVEYVILVCSGMNFIDANSLQILAQLNADLRKVDIILYFAEIKHHLRRRMEYVGFYGQVSEWQFFNTTHAAVESTGHLVDEDLPIG